MMMDKSSKIIVFGSGGLIGGEIVNVLNQAGYSQVVSCRHKDLELTDQNAVMNYMAQVLPDYIFFCAVKGITDFDSHCVGNAEISYSNIMMQCNMIQAAWKYGVKKAVFLGSAMLYPWNLDKITQPLTEDLLDRFNLDGYRQSMQATVFSKFICYKMCQYYNQQYGCKFLYCLPSHIYGGFHGRKNLYFLERLVMDICDARRKNLSEIFLDVYGEGKALKQFLHVRDCANAVITVMDQYEGEEPINIAAADPECWDSIVNKLCKITGYTGMITYHSDKKENMTNRLCSVEKLLNTGWRQTISMDTGLQMLCDEYMSLKG